MTTSHNMDIPDWKKALSEGGKFQIKTLAEWEDYLRKSAQHKTRNWINDLFKWVALGWGNPWSAGKIREFFTLSKEPISVTEWQVVIRFAFLIGQNEGSSDIYADSHSGKKLIVPHALYPPERLALPPHIPEKLTYKLTEYELNTIQYAEVSAALKMREWAAGMRDDVRWQVVQALKQRLSPEELAKILEGRWDKYGQNFQTIAITELNDAYNSGYLLSLEDGAHVTVPVIGDDRVCQYCKKLLEGKVFQVKHAVPYADYPELSIRHMNETMTWPGKSNINRKREDWIPCIPLHPLCRHRYVFYSGKPTAKYRKEPSYT